MATGGFDFTSFGAGLGVRETSTPNFTPGADVRGNADFITPSNSDLPTPEVPGTVRRWLKNVAAAAPNRPLKRELLTDESVFDSPQGKRTMRTGSLVRSEPPLDTRPPSEWTSPATSNFNSAGRFETPNWSKMSEPPPSIPPWTPSSRGESDSTWTPGVEAAFASPLSEPGPRTRKTRTKASNTLGKYNKRGVNQRSTDALLDVSNRSLSGGSSHRTESVSPIDRRSDVGTSTTGVHLTMDTSRVESPAGFGSTLLIGRTMRGLRRSRSVSDIDNLSNSTSSTSIGPHSGSSEAGPQAWPDFNNWLNRRGDDETTVSASNTSVSSMSNYNIDRMHDMNARRRRHGSSVSSMSDFAIGRMHDMNTPGCMTDDSISLVSTGSYGIGHMFDCNKENKDGNKGGKDRLKREPTINNAKDKSGVTTVTTATNRGPPTKKSRPYNSNLRSNHDYSGVGRASADLNFSGVGSNLSGVNFIGSAPGVNPSEGVQSSYSNLLGVQAIKNLFTNGKGVGGGGNEIFGSAALSSFGPR